MYCISVCFLCLMIAATWVLVTLRLSHRTISSGKWTVTYFLVNLTFSWIIHKAFWHLKVTQLLLCFWVNLVFVSFSVWIFISPPIGFLDASTVEKLLDLTPETFWKYYISPAESSSPYQGTVTGCFLY